MANESAAVVARPSDWRARLRVRLLPTVYRFLGAVGLRSFRGYAIHEIAVRVAKKLATFDDLECIEGDTKTRIRARVRRHLVQLETARLFQGQLLSLLTILFILPLYLALIITFFAAPAVLTVWLDFSLSPWERLAGSALYFLLFYAILGVVFFPFLDLATASRRNRRRHPKQRSFSVTASAGWVVIGWVGLFGLFYQFFWKNMSEHANFFVYILASALLPYVVLTAIVVVFAPLGLILYMLERRLQASHPDDVVVGSLVEILHAIESEPHKWMRLSFRRELMDSLERIATRIEHDLRRQLDSGDPTTNLWAQETLMRMGDGVRILKRLLITPHPDGRATLLARLTRSLEMTAVGNWSALEQVTLERTVKSRASSILRTAVVAAVPLGVLLIGIFSGLWPEGVVRDAAVAAAAAWLVLTVLASIDPLFNDKLTAIKTIRGIVPY